MGRRETRAAMRMFRKPDLGQRDTIIEGIKHDLVIQFRNIISSGGEVDLDKELNKTYRIPMMGRVLKRLGITRDDLREWGQKALEEAREPEEESSDSKVGGI